MPDIEKDLKNSLGDYAHSAGKTAIASIPLIGGAASELFSLLIAPPVSKRRDEWMVRLAKGLEELQSKYETFDISSLSNNDVFITTVLQATQSALRSHQEEKLEALKNAVINSALDIGIDENVQLMFLNLIDSMTPWHLRILSFFKNPADWFIRNGKELPSLYMGAPSHVLEIAFPELRARNEFVSQIVNDLNSQSLLAGNSLNTTMTGSGLMASRSTEFGNLFLKYISEP